VFRYAAAGKLGNLKVNDVIRHMMPLKGLSYYVQAKFISDTLHKYMASADDLITSAHVPETMVHESHGLIKIDHSTRMVSCTTQFSLVLTYCYIIFAGIVTY